MPRRPLAPAPTATVNVSVLPLQAIELNDEALRPSSHVEHLLAGDHRHAAGLRRRDDRVGAGGGRGWSVCMLAVKAP